MYRLIPVIGVLVPVVLLILCTLLATGVISQPALHTCIAVPVVFVCFVIIVFLYTVVIADWYIVAKKKNELAKNKKDV